MPGTATTAALGAEPPVVTRYPAPPPLPGQPGGPPVRRGGGGRVGLVIAAVIVVLLVLCGGTALAWNLVSGNGKPTGSGATGRATGQAGTGGNQGAQAGGAATKAGSKKQHAVVGKTAWYATFKVTFGAIDYDASGDSPQLTADLLVENLSTENQQPDFPLQLTIDGKSYPGQAKDNNTIAAGQKTDEIFEFQAYNFSGSIADGVLTIGDGKKAQATVPVTNKGELVAYEPKHVLDSTKVVDRDLNVTFTTCDLRGGFFDYHGQADKGYQALTCSVDLQYTGGSGGGHYVGEANFRLGLPDGTEIGPTVAPNEALYSADVKPGDQLGFQIKAPAHGTYLLRVVDAHGGETRSPTMVKETAITL